MPRIQIPKKYRYGIKKIITLDSAVFENLIDALRNSNPSFHLKNLADTVSLKIKEKGIENLTKDDLLNILEAIVSLYPLQAYSSLTLEDLASSLGEAVAELEDFPNVTEEQKKIFEARITTLLSINGALDVASKVGELLLEYEHLFLSSRIITDIRPVFDSDLNKIPAGALIVHTLKLEYKQGNEEKDFYIALDTNDVKKMREQLDRAEQKAKSIKLMLNQAQVSYLDVEER
jgi:hypothetical protein